MKQHFYTLYVAYKELAVTIDKKLDKINGYYNKLERMIQQLTKNYSNYKDIQDIVKDFTWKYNIIYYEIKEVELAKLHEIGRVVFQVQWLSENIETIATNFSRIREEFIINK